MKTGDLVIWLSPGKQVVLGIIVEQEMGLGGAETGWWRIFTDIGSGPKKYLTRESQCEVLRARDQC